MKYPFQFREAIVIDFQTEQVYRGIH